MANEMNNANHEHLEADHDKDSALRKIQTAGSISISPELFEKIYLSPQNVVKGDIRKTFANPTPVCLGGFLLCLSPLSCDLMGFQGITNYNSPGQATQGAYFFFGALLMILGAIGEFLLGNTFPMVVFSTFGAFWGWFGSINNGVVFEPWSNYLNGGIKDPNYWQSNAFFLIFMGVLAFVYLILSVRTNLVFFTIFLLLVPAFACLTKAFFDVAQYYEYLAAGDKVTATDYINSASSYITAGGALVFVVCMLGWWIFAAIMLAALDFPFQLPVGDLSHIVKGASERAQ